MDQLLRHAIHLASQTEKSLISSINRRVAYVVSHGQSYASNGYAVRTQGVAEALNENNFDTLCFVRPGRPWELGEIQGSFPPEKVVNGVRYIHSRWLTDDKVSNDLERLEASVKRFIELFLVYRPQFVLAASNWIVALPAWVAAKKLGLPFFYEVRGFWELSRVAREPSYESTLSYQKDILNEIFVYQQAQQVITLNEEMKEELVNRGVRVGNIKIMQNSIAKLPEKLASELKRSDFGISESDKVVGYIGSFTEYEGLELLKKACLELAKDGHRIKLLLLGGDKEEVGNGGEINVGRVSPEEVGGYYDLIDLVAIPRLDRKVTRLVTPIKLVEALSHNKKVLVSEKVPKGSLMNLNNVFEFSPDCVDSLKSEIVKSLDTIRFPSNRNVPIFFDEAKELASILASEKSVREEVSFSEALRLSLLSYKFSEGGCEEAVTFFSEKSELTKREYFELSNYFKAKGLLSLSGKVIEEYINKSRNDSESLKALFWIRQKQMDFEACHKIVNKLEGLGKLESKDIQKLRKSYGCYGFLKLFDSLSAHRSENNVDKNNKRICYLLHNSLPYSSGGYATRADGVAQGLKNSGYEVIVITRPGFPIDIKPELKSVRLDLEETISGISYRRILSPDRKSTAGVDYIEKASIELEKEFLELKPGVVIAASNHITAIPALIAARKLGIPFFYEVRGFWEVTRLSREPEYKKTSNYHLMVLYEALTARHADHVFTLTEPMCEELVERGVEENKITLLPNSCDPSRFTPRSRDEGLAKSLGIPNKVPVIGYIGSFVVYEGLELLAAACGMLKRKGIEFRLLIVGNENTSGNDRGPITKEIQDTAEEMGFSDWLIMPGRVPHEEVESYYSLIDIAPFPRKPWPVCEMVSPMKPLEALAMEKAVVVSSVRALVEMVKEDETGLVFNKGSVESLAEQLARLIDDPELRLRLGKSGREWVESERTWNSTTSIAKDILSKF